MSSDYRVSKNKNLLELRFADSEDAIQTQIDLQKPHQIQLLNLQYLLGILLFIEPPKQIAILGVGAGALIHFFRHHYPKTRITAVEIDQKLLQQAISDWGLPAADSQLSYIVEDALQWPYRESESFDLILSDFFASGETPSASLQPGYIEALQQRLTVGGALGMNLLVPQEVKYANFLQQLNTVFSGKTLQLLLQDYENQLVFAVKDSLKENADEPVSMQCIIERSLRLEQALNLPFREIAAELYQQNPVGQGLI